MISYIISIVHPWYRCPKVENIFNSKNTLEEVKEDILTTLYMHICELRDNRPVNMKIIEKIYNYEYEEQKLCNNYWEAKAFVNGEWIDVTSTHNEIYNKFLLENKVGKITDPNDYDYDDDNEDDENEDEDEDESDVDPNDVPINNPDADAEPDDNAILDVLNNAFQNDESDDDFNFG